MTITTVTSQSYVTVTITILYNTREGYYISYNKITLKYITHNI